MKGTLAAIAAIAALAGCAPFATSEGVARNPHHACSGEGFAPGTEAYSECVDAVVAERCGADANVRCAERLRDATFLAQQLELRGYRLFNQRS